MICITKSWCSDDPHINNTHQRPNYVSIHQGWKNGKTGGGITIFIHKELIHNIRHDLSFNDEDTEALFLEIINKKSKIIFINTIYRQLSGNKEILKIILVSFSKNKDQDNICSW